MLLPRCLLCLAALAALTVARHAEASPASRLVYARGPGAEECPDEAAFRQEVAARLGYDPFFPWATRTVSVEIEAADGRVRARVVVVDDKGFERGSQTIDAERGPVASSCVGLVRGVALAVSVSLDAMPSSERENKPEETKPEPPPPPPVVAPPVVAAPVVVDKVVPVRIETPRTHARKPRVRLALAPELWLGYGQWPVVTAGVGAVVDLGYGAWSMAFEGRWDAPSTVTLDTQGNQAQLERATGSVVACGHVSWLAVCAVGSFGETWASGVGVEGPQSASAFYAAFGGRVGLHIPLGARFHWSFVAELVGIATPMHVTFNSGDVLFNSGPVAASFGTSFSTSIF